MILAMTNRCFILFCPSFNQNSIRNGRVSRGNSVPSKSIMASFIEQVPPPISNAYNNRMLGVYCQISHLLKTYFNIHNFKHTLIYYDTVQHHTKNGRYLLPYLVCKDSNLTSKQFRIITNYLSGKGYLLNRINLKIWYMLQCFE